MIDTLSEKLEQSQVYDHYSTVRGVDRWAGSRCTKAKENERRRRNETEEMTERGVKFPWSRM